MTFRLHELPALLYDAAHPLEGIKSRVGMLASFLPPAQIRLCTPHQLTRATAPSTSLPAANGTIGDPVVPVKMAGYEISQTFKNTRTARIVVQSHAEKDFDQGAAR
jgi:hypothetical protein